jgi:immune inhibitor A
MKKNIFLLVFLLATYNLSLTALSAAPPNPYVYNVGNLPPDAQQKILGPRLPLPKGYGNMHESVVPPNITATTGTARVLVILVEFTDVKHASSHTQAYFQNLLFSSSDALSLYNYYKEASYDQLLIDDGDGNPATANSNNPSAWLPSSFSMKHYGEDSAGGIDDANGNVWELAKEAVQLLDTLNFDFSQYDTNADGTVDHVVIVHAGPAQENGGGLYGSNAIWSHRWDIGGGADNGFLTKSGVYVKGYTMQSEDSPVGIFAHEFGHDLGLPDLYDTITGLPGVGDWDLMDQGSWNGSPSGSSPAHPSAWDKILLNWTTAQTITAKQNDLTIYPLETTKNNGNKSIYKIPISVANDPTQEYYLITYDRKTGFDTNLPSEGLMVWHVDDSVGNIDQNNVNNSPNHRRLDLEGPNKSISSDIGGPYTALSMFGSPANKAYNGQDSGVTILGISGIGTGAATSQVYKDIIFNQALSFKKLINYPNPTYDGNTTISFTLTNTATDKSITIYNLAGELVRNVPDSYIQTQSVSDNNIVYIYDWDGKNNEGEKVFSGIYMCLIKAGDQKKITKIAVIK